MAVLGRRQRLLGSVSTAVRGTEFPQPQAASLPTLEDAQNIIDSSWVRHDGYAQLRPLLVVQVQSEYVAGNVESTCNSSSSIRDETEQLASGWLSAVGQIQTVSKPIDLAGTTSTRKLSPTNTISDKGTSKASSAWRKSFGEGFMLRESEEKTTTSHMSPMPAASNSESHGSFFAQMLDTTPNL